MDIESINTKVQRDQYVYSSHADLERKADDLTLQDVERAILMEKKCNFCGSFSCETRRVDYLYSYKGNYLLVQDTPVEVCQECGMIYYEASVLKEIEKSFFSIQKKQKNPENYIEIPRLEYGV